MSEPTLQHTRTCANCGHIIAQHWDYGSEHPDEPCPGPGRCIALIAGTSHIKVTRDVMERPCPHSGKGFGTIINQYCPQCSHRVGSYGYGAAGTLDCPCTQERVIDKSEIAACGGTIPAGEVNQHDD
ncbi:hypothetical protein P3F83_18170 [Mycobacteroides immunogenum]|uniref:hypothetical protein n=1 Tax=Mycobacteroides immunogenum TaxID=83262 RepID=UPI0025B794CC|nr:hypothetical protein [Mycobacteroides immunogenum]WJR32437.1 hypothetical protein P3F83_18170 [Mycobacteroides immunogenum]